MHEEETGRVTGQLSNNDSSVFYQPVPTAQQHSSTGKTVTRTHPFIPSFMYQLNEGQISVFQCASHRQNQLEARRAVGSAVQAACRGSRGASGLVAHLPRQRTELARRCPLAGPGSGHRLDAGSAGLAAHTTSGQSHEAPALFLPPPSSKQLGTPTANFPEQVADNLVLM